MGNSNPFNFSEVPINEELESKVISNDGSDDIIPNEKIVVSKFNK